MCRILPGRNEINERMTRGFDALRTIAILGANGENDVQEGSHLIGVARVACKMERSYIFSQGNVPGVGFLFRVAKRK